MENHIGLKIRKLRRGKNLSQTELADAIGVTGSQISAMESGKSEGSKAVIKKIADYFEVEFEELKYNSNHNSSTVSEKLYEELKSQIEYFKEMLKMESEKNTRLSKTLENLTSNFQEGNSLSASSFGEAVILKMAS